MTTSRRSRLGMLAAALIVAGTLTVPAQAQTSRGAVPASAAAAHPTGAYWLDQRQAAAARSASGAERAVAANRFRGLTLEACAERIP